MAKVNTGAFGGLATDLTPIQMRPGFADIAQDVTLEDGRIQKRGGFGEWEDDADGSATAIKHIDVAHFADGDVYVVVKLSDGKLYQRKIGATSFTQITCGQTHNGSDRGWSFMWADRWHYFDRAGGSRWNPDANSGTAYKAGLRRSAVGPTGVAAAGGEKDGRYRMVMSLLNSDTREEGAVNGPYTPATVCSIEADTGGISIDNWSTLKAANSDYEWTHAVFWSTLGSTEFIDRGTSGVESPSWVFYRDVEAIKTASTVGANKADHVLERTDRVTNAGGEPPGAEIGCKTSTRAIYGRVYRSSVLLEDEVQFSIPRYPTMVPRRHSYTVAGDSKTIVPRPYEGRVIGGIPGGAVAMAFGGGVAAAFGTTSAWRMSTAGDGTLYPYIAHVSKGAAGDGAAVGTHAGVHGFGYGSWLVITPDRTYDLSHNRFQTTLEEIPTAYLSSSVMGYYGYKEQVWCAVVKTGATVAQRILVWDSAAGGEDEFGRPIGALVQFDPANLDSDESITSMCELADSTATPTMLVATNKGRILQYPDGTDDDGTDFAASWQGYFGQRNAVYSQRISTLEIHAGSNVKDNVTFSWMPMRASGGTDAERTQTLNKSDQLISTKAVLGRVDARLYRVKFSSTASVSAQWSIDGIYCKTITTKTT